MTLVDMTIVDTKFDHGTVSVEAKLSANELYVETKSLTLSVQTELSEIDDEIASLLAIRMFLTDNPEVVKLSKVRDEVGKEIFGRPYSNLHDDYKVAVNRIIKAEGLVSK